MGQFVRSMLRILSRPPESMTEAAAQAKGGEEAEKRFNPGKGAITSKLGPGPDEPAIEHGSPEFYDLVFGHGGKC